MSSDRPVLYSFRRCPYAIRARLALYFAEIPHEHREVSLKNKPQEMLQLSPKGTVPVLSLEPGKVLEQSLDVMNWALQSPAISVPHAHLISTNDSTFKYALDRYKYPGRYDDSNLSSHYRKQCEDFLKFIEPELSPFLTGTTIALPDLALFPFIRQFSMVDPEWFNTQNYPHLKRWLDYFAQSDLLHQVMHKYEPWSSEDEPTLINFDSD